MNPLNVTSDALLLVNRWRRAQRVLQSYLENCALNPIKSCYDCEEAGQDIGDVLDRNVANVDTGLDCTKCLQEAFMLRS